MATNVILTPSVIAREALMTLSNTIVMGNLVRRDQPAPGEFANVGDTITVRKPATFVAADMTGAGIVAQDIREVGIPVVMSRWRGLRFGLTAKQASMSLRDYRERYIQPAAAAIAQDIDSFLCGLFASIPYIRTQTATTVVISDLALLGADLTVRKVPLEGRALVLDPLSAAKYKVLAPVLDASQRGNASVITDNRLGHILGFDTYESQNVHTEGTIAGSFATAITPAALALGAESMVCTASAAGNGLIPAGTLFTIAGDTQVYSMTEDATMVAAVGCTLHFSPPLQVAVATTQAITIGTTTTGKTQSFAFHRNCMNLVTCPLATPVAAPSEVLNADGLSVRVTYSWDSSAMSDVVTLDVLYGGRVLDVELGERLIGQ
jgi:hypothetical protein